MKWYFSVVFFVMQLSIGFGWAQSKKPDINPLPKQTPLSGCAIDKDGVQYFHLPNGEVVYNIFEVASQAMSGNASCIIYKNSPKPGLLPRSVNLSSGEGIAEHEFVALQWLIDHAEKAGDSALVWRYRFDNAYNDVSITAPWASAFGQAHVLKAFMAAYKKTGDIKYKKYATQAAAAYDIPIESGGFKAILPDGSFFFEEVPALPASHILNGHLISLVALFEAADVLEIGRLRELASKGLDGLKKYIDLYDVGYWSRYDLNPKKQEVIFRFDVDKTFSDEDFYVHAIKLKNLRTGRSYDLDVGAAGDADGSIRISGIDWGQSMVLKGRSVRAILNGRLRRSSPVVGGSDQNSYFIFSLPDPVAADYADAIDYELQVEYFDSKKSTIQVQIQDINHGNSMRFVNLPDALRLTGNGGYKISKIFLSNKFLGWYMGVDYHKYHIKLLRDLYDLTAAEFLKSYFVKWEGYLRRFDNDPPK